VAYYMVYDTHGLTATPAPIAKALLGDRVAAHSAWAVAEQLCSVSVCF